MKIITTNLLNRFWKNGVKPIKDAVSKKLDKSKVVNNLLTTEGGYALDARQGAVLNARLDKLYGNVEFTSSILGIQQVNGVGYVNVGGHVYLFSDVEGGNIAIDGPDGTRWEMDSYDGVNFRIFNSKSPTRAFSFSHDAGFFNLGNLLKIINTGGYTIMQTSGDHFDFKDMNGSLVNVGALGFVTGSSCRYKENIHPMDNERADKILNLDVVTYDYKQGITDDRYNRTGVIAEECISVIPEAVICRKTDGKTVPDGVDYTRFVPYLIKTVQKQQKQINELYALLQSLTH